MGRPQRMRSLKRRGFSPKAHTPKKWGKKTGELSLPKERTTL